MMSRALLLYGTEEPVPPSRDLIAGPLSAVLDQGQLRAVRFGGVEIIRAISFLIRGPTWATLAARITDLIVEESAAGFTVTYHATVGGLDYAARIEGAEDGRLSFGCDLHAVTDFHTARAGFVVLHPASVAGLAVRIEHADGEMTDGAFPELIDPVQPMLNLRALTHEPAPGLRVTCRMEGDVFEMEDQRNWTDASFKTYVRPLSRPWPYILPAGSRGSQRVAISVTSDRPAPAIAVKAAPIEIMPGSAIGPMPAIGLGCTPAEARAALPHAALLAQAGVAILVCRYDTGEGHDEADLRVFQVLAEAIQAGVELQIVVRSLTDHAAELRRAADSVRAAGLTLRAVAISPAADLKSVTPGQPWPPCPPLPDLVRSARAAFPGLALHGGMFATFTELNRKRPDPSLLDTITFATSPLVHAADDLSVMESLESLPAVAASVRAIAGGTPYAVGPSAIGLRDNPYGPAPLENPGLVRQPMSGADPRQTGLFNAAWTLGHIARFAAGGAARIAVSAPAGTGGISDGGRAFPVFHVIQGFAALLGATVHAVPTTRERDVLALLAAREGHRELWLANLTPDAQEVVIPDPFRDAELSVLDAVALTASAVWRAGSTGRTVSLDAYAVLRCRG